MSEVAVVDEAVAADNVLVVVQAALVQGHGKKTVDEELSYYHLATEVAVVSDGMALAVPEPVWARFVQMSGATVAAWMQQVAKGLNWRRHRTNPRGPKKPVRKQRTRRGAHRSPARVLQDRYHHKAP